MNLHPKFEKGDWVILTREFATGRIIRGKVIGVNRKERHPEYDFIYSVENLEDGLRWPIEESDLREMTEDDKLVMILEGTHNAIEN